ncbi:S1 RNA-binding domain-containing protein [Streptomyces sp. Q6]|uniref:S1 RNA-binding domain-containing protein n=1 Tax=Streptomyces citrinus TaxID=3118173 RepID=A0ACD5A607_9ACTN
MSESTSDPRLQALINRLQPGPVEKAVIVGFDGSDALVTFEDEVGRIDRQELSMRRVEHPSEIFRVGQEIEAEVIGRWRGELHLSARACENPELRAFLLGIRPGQILTGTVSAVHNFGVFVHMDGEPDGLCTGFIRVVDLTWSRINHASEAVEVGQRVTGEVITSETRRGQVTVSLKALQEDPLLRFADHVDQVICGPITKIIPFGIFVQLADSVEGFLHLSDLTEEPVESPDLLVREGELITVRVSEVDLQRHRVRLCSARTGDDV